MQRWSLAQFVGYLGLLSLLLAPGGCGQSEGDTPASPESAQEAQPSYDPGSIDDALMAANQYFNGGRFDEALAILVVLVQRAPKEGRAWEMYGQTIAMKAKQAELEARAEDAKRLWLQAYGHYQQAIVLDPESSGLHQSTGMISLSAGRTAEALQHFLKAGELDPSDPQPPVFAAQLLMQTGRYNEAEAELLRAHEIDPDQPMVHASRAVIELQRENYEAARRFISLARQINPLDIGLLAQEARIHHRAGQPRRSLEMLLLLTDEQKTQIAVAEELAAGYLAIDQPLDTAAVWVNRSRHRPEAADRWQDAIKASEAFLMAGDREEAWLWLQDAKRMAPDDEGVTSLEAKFADTHNQESSED
ncbi:MAG: tetratricopeptide repeat protein [Planctomycetota bacterium]|nr:tetratricopeptide repeat protein [Planctomycetota bacterium]